MSEHAAVLFANDAFYLAFAERDFDAMDGMWARQSAVTCIHPGWSMLSGRDEVMESWEAIMANTESPKIECRNVEAHVHGDFAYVVCHEALAEGFLIATNIYTHEDGAWKLVHHQAGPAPEPPAEEEPEPANIMQ